MLKHSRAFVSCDDICTPFSLCWTWLSVIAVCVTLHSKSGVMELLKWFWCSDALLTLDWDHCSEDMDNCCTIQRHVLYCGWSGHYFMFLSVLLVSRWRVSFCGLLKNLQNEPEQVSHSITSFPRSLANNLPEKLRGISAVFTSNKIRSVRFLQCPCSVLAVFCWFCFSMLCFATF
jgi:hypothetical protein